MCNTYNTWNTASTNTNSCCGNGFWNLFNGYQRVCRDSCGNLRVISTNNCGYNYGNRCRYQCGCHNCCHCCCHQCCNGCSCGGTGSGTGTGTGNGTGTTTGGYGCIVLCGNTLGTGTASTTSCGGYSAGQTVSSGDAYYARQYGLYGRSSCGVCNV